jgi:hypothetical protein
MKNVEVGTPDAPQMLHTYFHFIHEMGPFSGVFAKD